MEIAHRQGNDKDANAPPGRYFYNDACQTRKNETVSMDVLLKICKLLDCNVGDIMDVINEETSNGDQ